MTLLALILALATVWCVGSLAPVLVDMYRADMVGKPTRAMWKRLGLRVAVLIILIILQVIL